MLVVVWPAADPVLATRIRLRTISNALVQNLEFMDILIDDAEYNLSQIGSA